MEHIKSISQAIKDGDNLDGYIKSIDIAYLQTCDAIEEFRNPKCDTQLVFDYVQEACYRLRDILDGVTYHETPF